MHELGARLETRRQGRSRGEVPVSQTMNKKGNAKAAKKQGSPPQCGQIIY
jgi:hypothetical protein